jgi:hypothetical protein
MDETSNSLPSRKEELDLHRRLADLDPTAPVDVAVAYLTPLIHWLAKFHKRAPEDLRNEAAEDAICNLSRDPGTYDPSRGKSLWGFLKMSAAGDLINALAKEKRNKKAENLVELSMVDGKCSLGDEGDPSVTAENCEEARIIKIKILPVVRKGLSDKELRVLDLILDGEKKTDVYAEACGISHLPKDEQEKEVKRIKGKVNKRIERARQDHG